MDTNTHAYLQTHRIHSCKHYKKTHSITSAVAKGCHGQLNSAEHSQTQI